MSKTNFQKLIRWDADYYKELTDDDCIVCLTEREVYLVGQIIEVLTWASTRWLGDITGLDFKAISAQLEHKLSERMTCQNITTLLQKITQLETKLDYVFNQTVVNEGDTPFSPDTTVADDVFTPAEMQTGDMAVQADVCDNAGKSQIYGATNQVVRYIVGLNTDLLQQFEQAVGNIAEQAETLLGAFPVTDFLAVDDAAKYVAFLTQELQEEYEAIVDEELIQQTICDIFCIASANNCKLTMWDIYNYFGSKIDPTFTNAALTYANLVNFAFVGTFTGDMYFHYLCYFQLASAMFNGAITGDGLEAYERQIAAGFNSPDADWMIHCIACPPMYRLFTVDFSIGMAEFVQTTGIYSGGRLTNPDATGGLDIVASMVSNPAWRVRAGKMYYERQNGIHHGSQDTMGIWFRPTPNSGSGQVGIPDLGFEPNGVLTPCQQVTIAGGYRTGFNQITIGAGVSNNGDTGEIWIDKIEILFEMNYAPERAVISYDGSLCV